jgi:hypothetical protein
MPYDLTTQTFLEGDYQSPIFTENFPGQFPPPAPPFGPGPFRAGEPVAFNVTLPLDGGTLTLSLFQRGQPDLDLLEDADEAEVDLGEQEAGTIVACALDPGFSSEAPPDAYCWRAIQRVTSGETIVTRLAGEGSFDILPVGF